jgi:hypothetical protein
MKLLLLITAGLAFATSQAQTNTNTGNAYYSWQNPAHPPTPFKLQEGLPTYRLSQTNLTTGSNWLVDDREFLATAAEKQRLTKAVVFADVIRTNSIESLRNGVTLTNSDGSTRIIMAVITESGKADLVREGEEARAKLVELQAKEAK